MRYVAQFSCGAASACATKIALDRYGADVHIINAFVAAEDDDNRRFLADCEKWFGREIVVLRDEKYGADPANVWRKKRFIKGQHGAPCSKALKRDVLDKYRQPDDVIVFGYTADTHDAERFDRWIDANADKRAIAPLIEQGLTKDDCFQIVKRAGIELPLMYRLGFPNANCRKCPNGGLGYWNAIRKHFPDDFEEVASIQDVLGPGSYFLTDRRGGKRVRVSLRMLDPGAGRMQDEPSFECGGQCEFLEFKAPAEVA